MKKSFIGCLSIIIFTSIFVYSESRVVIHQVDVSNFPSLKAYISIIDDNGESIKGLDKSNFSLVEDGIRITGFECTSIFQKREWLSIILAIDKSGSMKGEPLNEAKKGARAFLKKVGLSDRVSLVFFDKEISKQTDFIQDKDLLENEIDLVVPKGNTALYDTLIKSLERLISLESPRKSIVILTDGKDTESKANLNECMSKIINSKVPIYIIGLGAGINKEVIIEIAEQSQGNYYFASSPTELQKIYSSIAAQLENQYIIKYLFHGNDEIETHTLLVNATIGNEILRDKIFYSLITSSTAAVKVQSKDVFIFSVLIPSIIGGIIGLVIFMLLSHLLFRGISESLGLKRSFIILGVILFMILAVLITNFI